MLSTYSLHEITSKTDFPFSPNMYSRFKFGCKESAREMGTALGEAFCKDILPDLEGDIVIISSPYCFIPTATFAMKDYFLKVVNNWLVENERPVVEETRIHRTITYRDDYGALSAEDRLKLIQGDTFHIDAEFVKNKTLILLDDVKITGGHEKVVENTIQKYGLGDCRRVYTYFAELTNKDVNPNVENVINHYTIDSLSDVDRLIWDCCSEYILNTRVVKYILNNNALDFISFVNERSHKFLETLYHLSIGNSYHTIDEYKDNLNILKNQYL